MSKKHLSAAFLETIDNEQDVTINLRNGIMRYDGSKVTLEPHCKEAYFTYCLDFDFDTNAECSKFHKYLDRVLPDKEQQALLQEYLGYCLSGLFLKHEKAMMLYGPMGSGGKSVLHDTLEGIFKGRLMSNYSLSEISQPLHRYNMQESLINYILCICKLQNLHIFHATTRGIHHHTEALKKFPEKGRLNLKCFTECFTQNVRLMFVQHIMYHKHQSRVPQ